MLVVDTRQLPVSVTSSLIKVKRHLPSMSFCESHRRRPSIPTAQARLQGLQADPRRLADATAAH